jgi:hypothetical protein
MDPLDPKLVEHVARAMCPGTFKLPRINLYRHDYREAFEHAEIAIRAIDEYRIRAASICDVAGAE